MSLPWREPQGGFALVSNRRYGLSVLQRSGIDLDQGEYLYRFAKQGKLEEVKGMISMGATVGQVTMYDREINMVILMTRMMMTMRIMTRRSWIVASRPYTLRHLNRAVRISSGR